MRFFSILGVILASTTFAQETDPSAGMVEVTQAPTLAVDREALAEAFDSFFEKGLVQQHVPGAVLVVVHDGDVILKRGYGLANVAARTPADPDETLFRIGSVSKLLTATGVMRLVEKGTLDLHAPINQYLKDFQVPPFDGVEVTLWHLLTHTAGFDDRFLAIAKPSPAELEPTGQFLARRLPPIVTRPGSVMNYSNFGMTLAAHVVECVTGQPFALHLDDTLLGPLGMARGGFDQPLPPTLSPRLAENYTWDGELFVPSVWSHVASQIYPSGLYAATATDMAKFMLFHLNFGRIGTRRYMRESTIRDMHRAQFRNHPDLVRGHGLGFHTRMRLDHPVVWHTGLTDNFTAQLVLAPQDNCGFYVACNSARGGRFHNGAFEIFAKHFLRTGKYEQPEVTTPDPLAGENLDFTGTYRPLRRVRSTMVKLKSLGEEIRLVPDRQTGLLQWGGFNTGSSLDGDHWRPIVPGVYGAIRSAYPRRMAFERDDAGNVKYAFLEAPSFTVNDAFERIAWYETTRFHIGLHVACAFVFLTMLLRIWRRRRKNRIEGPPVGSAFETGAWGRRVGGVVVVLNVAFAAGMALYINFGDVYAFQLGVPLPVMLLLVLPLLSLAGTIALTLIVAEEWRRRALRSFARIHTMVTALACWAFLWSLSYWNLLGYCTG